MARPIAQISCWMTENPFTDLQRPAGFHAKGSPNEEIRRHNSQTHLDFPLIPGRTVTVGRNHHENDISINHPNVSRKHFVIYSVVYDFDDVGQPPMIYIRDCQSLEGTYVDGKCIGNKENGMSVGYYISRDVEITINPYWSFRVSLLHHNEMSSPLTAIQLKESTLFNHRYIITERTLGGGAFASVYLAVDAKTGSQLACKIHDLDRLQRFHGSKDLIRRIMHETDILGKLRHPNLPTFEYAFRSKHTLYTFTELATGGDLFSMRLTRGAFAERDCKFVIQQLVNALRYLHEGGIAHRDLKPENVLFASGPGIMSRVILCDLGFAKSTASGRMVSRVGTSQYMAPEVEYGRTHDLTVDIWSLGMIVVFLLAPDNLVAPDSPLEWSQVTINQWLISVFEDPSHQKISKHCQLFIRSCLVFEPSARIKASEAKRHAWFQVPDNDEFKFRMRENDKAWNPTHLIAPPVQELPDMRSDSYNARQASGTPHSSVAICKLGKRKFDEQGLGVDSFEASPHFAQSKSPAPKRLQMYTSSPDSQTYQNTKHSANAGKLGKGIPSSPDPLSH